MVSYFTVLVGVVSSIAAAGAQAVAHQIAQRHRWRRIPRYVTGISIIGAAYAPVIFSALPLDQAAILYGLFWLITGLSGLSTWLSYEADPKPPGGATPEADEMLRNLEEELGR